jgi:hypothetical protein
LRRQKAGVVIATALTVLCVSAPLFYIYLHAEAANGFLIGNSIRVWREQFGSVALSFAAPFVALAFMMMEVGWLAAHALLMSWHSPQRRHLFWALAPASAFLLSTSLISFSGANNFAMRGAVVPTFVIACVWAKAISRHRSPMTLTMRSGLVAAATLAIVAHANEFFFLGNRTIAALSNTSESEECKQHIRELNSGPLRSRADISSLKNCRTMDSLYSLEVPFLKPSLDHADNELKGRGP